MKKKLYFVVIIFILIIGGIVIQNFVNMLTHDMNSILKKYKAKESEFVYYNKNTFNIESAGYSHYAKQRLYEMQDTDKLLYYEFEQKQWKPDVNPIEIYALFDIWLTLKEKSQEYKEILAVASLYKVVNLSNNVREEILIFREEFEEFLLQSSHISFREEKIVLMANMWIEKYYYNRTGLKTSNEWNSLLTPWKGGYYLINDELEYCAYFSKFHNLFEIMRINYLNTKNIKAVFKEELNESGYLYGVWKDNLDFWTWGETSGFKCFKYTGETTWDEQECDNDSPPGILQKISQIL